MYLLLEARTDGDSVCGFNQPTRNFCLGIEYLEFEEPHLCIDGIMHNQLWNIIRYILEYYRIKYNKIEYISIL